MRSVEVMLVIARFVVDAVPVIWSPWEKVLDALEVSPALNVSVVEVALFGNR